VIIHSLTQQLSLHLHTLLFWRSTRFSLGWLARRRNERIMKGVIVTILWRALENASLRESQVWYDCNLSRQREIRNLIVDRLRLFKLHLYAKEALKRVYRSSLTMAHAKVNGHMYCLTILILWITTSAECSTLASITKIVCPGSQKSCGDKFCYDPAT
jgi:hypothetical protein